MTSLFSGWGPFMTPEQIEEVNNARQGFQTNGPKPTAPAPKKPDVKNINGVSYNINTPEGKAGYEAAVKKGGKDTTPEFIEITGADGRPRLVNPNSEAGKETIRNIKPKTLPKPETEPVTEPEPTRDVDAPDGSGAKGTQMSPKIDLGAANALLKGLNIGEMADVNSFLSEQLPASPGEKQGQGKQTSLTNDEFILQAQAGGYLDDFKGGTNDEAILHAQGAGFTPAVVVEGSSTPGQTGVTPADTADNNRSVSVPGEEVAADPKNSGTNWGIKKQPSFERARRDAFLNLDNRGYSAIRAADAATGRFRQGDKYFYNVGGNLQEVNEETYRQGQHRQLSADELKSGYVEGIKSTLVPADQPDVTNPYQSETGVEMPKGEAPEIPAGAAPITPATTVDTDDTEFNINNQAPTYETQVDMKGKYFDKGDDK